MKKHYSSSGFSAVFERLVSGIAADLAYRPIASRASSSEAFTSLTSLATSVGMLHHPKSYAALPSDRQLTDMPAQGADELVSVKRPSEDPGH